MILKILLGGPIAMFATMLAIVVASDHPVELSPERVETVKRAAPPPTCDDMRLAYHYAQHFVEQRTHGAEFKGLNLAASSWSRVDGRCRYAIAGRFSALNAFGGRVSKVFRAEVEVGGRGDDWDSRLIALN